MQGILLILCIVILIILLTLKSDLAANLKALREKINFLDSELQRMKHSKFEEKPNQADSSELLSSAVKPVVKAEPEIPKVKIIEEEPERSFKPTPAEKKIVTPVEEEFVEPIKPSAPPAPPKPGFFERNPDLEKFIGENLANKIGIGILVLGIGFFVKYAIDQNWIHETGRVLIGVVCGGALLGLAHYLRKKFTAFSSVLVGGGIAVLYLTITIGFQQYQTFSQTAAFIIMIGITAFTIALSLGYNRMELAILAILGGFGSPFMVSRGEGNYIVLFTYILTLNVGMLVLAYYKKWNPVNIICYVFTLILFSSWLGTKFDGNNLAMVSWALFFSTSFYLVFFAMNMINNLKEQREFKALEFTMLLSATFFYYSAGMYVLSYDLGFAFRGLFTASLAIFNFIFAYSLYRNARVDKNLVFLLIGLVLTFISLAAPVQLEGNYITMFWSAEGVLLLWLSQKSGIKLMKVSSLIVNGLMVISLIMDWNNLYFSYEDISLNVLLNKAYITGLFSLGSMAGTIYLLHREKEDFFINIRLYQTGLTITAIVVCYLFNLFELQYQMRAFEVTNTAFDIVTGIYSMIFILGLLVLERFLILPEKARPVFAAWGPVAAFMYLLDYYSAIEQARYLYFSDGATNTGFFLHYILVAILLAICVLSIRAFRKLTEFNKNSSNLYSWFFVGFFVFLASFELDHLVALLTVEDSDSLYRIVEQTHKIGWPILWGSGAFIIIFVGLKQKIRHLRIISLVLFLITLLKLFLVDIKGISEGGKIAAFISLGILLLIISFMYQRLKKILMADETVHPPTEKSEP